MRPDVLKANGVNSILSLIDFPTVFPQDGHGIEWHGVRLHDGVGNRREDVELALLLLDRLHEKGKVMVHCAEGLSRSVFIVACYLVWRGGFTLEEAIQQVKRQRRNAAIDQGLQAIFPHIRFDCLEDG